MNMNKLLQSIPDEAGVKELKEKYDACEKQYNASFGEYIKSNTNFTMDMFKTAVDVIASRTGKDEAASVDKLQSSSAKRIFGVDAEKVQGVLDVLKDGINSCMSAQNDLVNAAGKATDSALEWCAKNNKLQLKALLEPLKQQQDDINNQINELKEKINLSTSMNQDETEDGQGNADKPEASEVAPNKVTDQFTQVIIDKKLSAATQASSMQSNASQSSSGVSFFFGGYSSNKSHQDSVSSEMSSTSDMDIQIGMSVAKVSIEREWFNPAVFLLSSDMYNTSTQKIAPVDTTSFASENKEEVQKRFNSMNECIFPCYPVSFVIAKDVTIKFSSQKAMNSEFAKSVEDHSSKGGGFFIFGGSSSSSSSSSNSSSVATSTAHSVTVRFTAPQVIGYYLEAVPADKSIHISNAVTNRDDDFISVLQFINTFKKMLDDHNNKYNKEQIQESK